MPKKIPVPPRHDLLQMIEKRMSPIQISLHYGVDPKVVRNWLKHHDLKSIRGTGRPFAQVDDAIRQTIAELSAQGLRIHTISRRVGVRDSTVSRVVEECRAARLEILRRPVQRSKPSAEAIAWAWGFGIASGQGHQPSLNLEAA